jgi:predicted nucleic acid-binding protein
VIVIDASAALDWLLKTPVGLRIEERIYAEPTVHAPHLLDTEVAQVLRRFVREGSVSAPRAEIAIATLMDAGIERYSHWQLLPRIWQLRHNLTAYDAAYVALAELLDATLVTRDRKLSGASGHNVRIDLF